MHLTTHLRSTVNNSTVALPLLVPDDANCTVANSRLNSSIATYGDLFCGVGGFHVAADTLGLQCKFACDIDDDAQQAYETNFGIRPLGDISKIVPHQIPDVDILCAGFPCQPFSIIGDRRATADPRGTMFWEIVRLAKAKRPEAMVLENVRQLVTISGGKVFRQIIADLESMGYFTDWRILNALDYGLPQKRERVLIVATRKPFTVFPWPTGNLPMKPLTDVLEQKPHKRHYVSERIRNARYAAHKSPHKPGIWHENKGGNVNSHPFSCALRAGASYNYLLVDGKRRLTPREMFRLQGFPDDYQIIGNDSQARKQAGNAIPVPLARAAIAGVLSLYAQAETQG